MFEKIKWMILVLFWRQRQKYDSEKTKITSKTTSSTIRIAKTQTKITTTNMKTTSTTKAIYVHLLQKLILKNNFIFVLFSQLLLRFCCKCCLSKLHLVQLHPDWFQLLFSDQADGFINIFVKTNINIIPVMYQTSRNQYPG